MIDLPARVSKPAEIMPASTNPFTSVITPDVVAQILTKQVQKAQAGDSAAASLILKIAMAQQGKNQAPRTNPETPQQNRPTVALVVSQLRGGPLELHQLAARLSCEAEDVQHVLERSSRFAVNSRGLWSLAPAASVSE